MWTKRILSTETADFSKLEPAIKGLYKAANLVEPEVILVKSPIMMVFMFGACSVLLDKKKAKVRHKKSISTSVLIKKLDALYSVYIRLKGIEKDGYVKCFTCDRSEYWRKIQNGHFQSRRFLSTRFYDLNCAPQCYACNVGLSGMQYEYGIRLDKKYGEGTAQHIVELSKEICKYNSDELLKMIDETEQKIQFLRKLKDIWD